MTHLGDLGTVHEDESLTFGYFGATLRTHPGLTDLMLIDVIETVGEAEDADGLEALRMFRGLVASLVHPDDVDDLWRLAKANGQTSSDIGDMCEQIIEAVTDRPTVRPSESSDGPHSTGRNSVAGSSSPAIALLEGKGRPDLALVVVRTEEFMASA
jgi:hypothetical protein